MSKEKIGEGVGAFQLFLIIAIVAAVIVLVGAAWYILFSFVPDPNPVKITNLTIEHLWEEDGKYYFAGSEGVVYKIERPHGRVMYETMPKTRFNELKEGGQYQVKYRCDWGARISISEKEMVR